MMSLLTIRLTPGLTISVMAGRGPAIHVLPAATVIKPWVAGPSPAMTQTAVTGAGGSDV